MTHQQPKFNTSFLFCFKIQNFLLYILSSKIQMTIHPLTAFGLLVTFP